MWHKQTQRGFTFIELMMVVFIIGILSAIAIPAYLGYTTRAKISEGLVLGSGVQRDVETYWNIIGVFPESNGQAGASVPTNYKGNHVGRIEVGPGGKITIYYDDPSLLEASLELTPTVANQRISWSCSSSTIRPSLLPKVCR